MFVRKDLSPSQQAVQAIHAGIEAARFSLITADETHPHVVLCGVNNQDHLDRVSVKLSQAGIRFKNFIEPDIGNEITALATEPLNGEQRSLLRNYQCLKL